MGALDLLLALDGAELGDVLPDQIAVVGLEWAALKGLLYILDGGVQIPLSCGLVHPAGLRREQQGLPAVVQLLDLLLRQAGMGHARGYVVSQLQNGIAPFLRVSRRQQQNRGYSERERPHEAHPP